jgi:DNA-binding GntR family transcriptional regulator
MELPTLDRNSPIPVYHQLADWFRENIANQEWSANFKLDSEIELAEKLDLSRGTVRKAMEELISEGLLIRSHGRGTFVAATESIGQSLASDLIGTSEELIKKGIDYETEVLNQKIVVPQNRISSLLSLPPEKRILFLERVRKIQNQPFIYIHNYVNYQYCIGIEKIDFSKIRLFEALESGFHLSLSWGRRTFEARLCPKVIADKLCAEVGSALMYLEQIVYLADGTPIEVSNVWFRGDRFKLSVDLKRKGGITLAPMQIEFE